MSEATSVQPVLILGAGINGCAVARELALHGIPLVIVDQADIATGATAKSSRLIHGGLRYLEYGDFQLVAESLSERERLLRLAAPYVRPLKLYIPVSRRWGGLPQSVLRFFRLGRSSLGRKITSFLPNTQRGLLVVRMGLWLYDRIAKSSLLPGHQMHRVGRPGTPSVDAAKFPWVCSYYDAQMVYPERFVIALLEDAQQAAEKSGALFRVLTYHRAEFRDRSIVIRPASGDSGEIEFQPSAVVNATGAWGDYTLQDLGIDGKRLFGGTKGSHFLTQHAGLRQGLGDGAVYAEAPDGRLVFILPFNDLVLVGTTDERFERPPDEAVATEKELTYLIGMVNDVFPACGLTRSDVLMHYSGVRPLPHVETGRTGAIPRGHWIHTTENSGIPLLTLIGGKLTTFRAFAEEVADQLFEQLGTSRSCDTRDRPVPGAEDYPADVQAWCDGLATETGFAADQTLAVFNLCGTRARDALQSQTRAPSGCLPGTKIPVSYVDQVIAREWVSCVSDLVERRLGLIFSPALSRETLEVLADRLCGAEKLSPGQRAAEIDQAIHRLQQLYGIVLPQTEAEART